MCRDRDPVVNAAMWTTAALLVIEAVGLVVWVGLQLAAAGAAGQADPSLAWRRVSRWPTQSFWLWYLVSMAAYLLLVLLARAAPQRPRRRQTDSDPLAAASVRLPTRR